MKISKNFSKNSIKRVLLDKSSSVATHKEKIDIILSPSFYWMKVEELDIKSRAQVLKIAPSIFEGTIPAAEYSYFVLKEGTRYTIFAYEDKKILDFLNSHGIDLGRVNRFYFAQTELGHVEHPIKINDSISLVNQDGLVSAIASSYVQNAVNFENLAPLALSKHSVPIKRYDNAFLDEKSIFALLIPLFMLVLLYSVDLKMHKSVYTQKEHQISEIYESNNLPSTSFEIESIKKKLMRIDKEQRKLREDIKYILSLPLGQGEYVNSIEKGKNDISVQIVLGTTARASVIKSFLEKRFKTSLAKFENDKKFYIKLKS